VTCGNGRHRKDGDKILDLPVVWNLWHGGEHYTAIRRLQQDAFSTGFSLILIGIEMLVIGEGIYYIE